MEYFVNDIIDGNSLTLDEYLDILLNGNFSKLYPNICFPSNEMLEEYLKTVENVSDFDIKKIIYRFLVQEGSYGINKLQREHLKKDTASLKELHESYPVFIKRLVYLGKPWEGLTWVLDLLPDYPKDVPNVLDSFFAIYCQFLPDDVMFGFSCIDQIIRAKYLQVDHPVEVLHDASPHEFERIIAELYSEMGFEVELTKKSHDGGIDIIARNSSIAKKELILIQCKRYKQNITVKDIRELIGIVEINNATKGVFCTSGDYTVASKKLAKKYNRIELLNAKEIIKLCNENMESNWPIKIGTFSQKYQKLINTE